MNKSMLLFLVPLLMIGVGTAASVVALAENIRRVPLHLAIFWAAVTAALFYMIGFVFANGGTL